MVACPHGYVNIGKLFYCKLLVIIPVSKKRNLKTLNNFSNVTLIVDGKIGYESKYVTVFSTTLVI